jgi:hypothetical protein
MRKPRFDIFSLLQFILLTACGNESSIAQTKTATLKIGEGVQFSTGKITRSASEGDMVLRYLPPQSPHGWRYNPATGQIEYQAQAGSTENYPLLSAAKTGGFKTKPDISKLTAGDINQWTEDEFDIGPGRFLVARGYNDKKHWLIRVLKFTATSNDPKTWQLSFSYEPLNIATGAAGTAGTNIKVPGILSFRERLHSQKIISLDLSNGKVNELFDGFGVSRNQKGEYAYINTSQQIILADKNGNQISVFKAPASAFPDNTIGGSGSMEAVLSPSGNYIAVGGITLRTMYTEGGISVPTVPQAAVAIVDRSGKEITSFISANYPVWTASGRLAMADPDKPGIFITDASLKNIQNIPNVPAGHIEGIAISADEKKIAFSLNYRIWLINMDGTGLRQLTQSGLNEVTPEWSPDGNYLAFQQSFKDKKEFYQVLVVRMSDNKVLTITDQQGANREPQGRMYWLKN